MKKLKKYFFVLFLMVTALVINTQIVSASSKNFKNITTNDNKEVRYVKFNKSVDINSAKNGGVIVKDSKGTIINDVIIKQGRADDEISISPSGRGYKYNDTYSIEVTDNMKSSSGVKLKEAANGSFTVKPKITIDNVPNTNTGNEALRVAIDPRYTEKSGVLGAFSKDVNLSIASQLGMILKQKGVNVYYTRMNDTNPGSDKMSGVKDFNPDIFVGVCTNNDDESSTGNGIEGYYNNTNSLSSTYSGEVLQKLASYTGAVNRGNKDGGAMFSEFSSFDKPAFMSYMGFISNIDDETNLVDEQYQQKCAQALADVILSHKDDLIQIRNGGQTPKPDPVPTTKYSVCLDAGHGGKDPGAGGYGINEKDVTLSVTLKIGNILKNKGINIIYTRTDDTYVSLQRRCDIANNAKTDIFLSVHCNSFDSESAHGSETWYYTNASAKTAKLAQIIEKNLVNAVGLTDRGVKTGGLYVNKYTSMPSVLAELAFISNKKENDMLRSDTYQNKFADAIARGICEYLGVKY